MSQIRAQAADLVVHDVLNIGDACTISSIWWLHEVSMYVLLQGWSNKESKKKKPEIMIKYNIYSCGLKYVNPLEQ